jgi:hypothetical protein
MVVSDSSLPSLGLSDDIWLRLRDCASELMVERNFVCDVRVVTSSWITVCGGDCLEWCFSRLGSEKCGGRLDLM